MTQPSFHKTILGLLALLLTLGLAAQSGAQIQKFFVVDSSDDDVYRYTEAYAATSSWATAAGNTDGTDVYVDNTYVYVLDNTDKQVYRTNYAGGAATPSRVLRDAAGVALGQISAMTIYNDDLWVADETNNRLYRYSLTTAMGAGGNYTALNGYNMDTATGNNDAQGMVADGTYLYVLDGVDQRLYRYAYTAPAGATVGSVMRSNGGGTLNNTRLEGAALDGTTLEVIYDYSPTILNQDIIYDYANFATGLFAAPGTPVNASGNHNVTGQNDDSRGIGVNPDPAVLSIVRADPSPTNAASVAFTVTFSESVTGVNAGDFALALTGFGTQPTLGTITGSGAVWTVNVNTGTGDGTIRLNFVDDDSVIDTAGNLPVGGSGLGNGNFNLGEVYTIDKTAPTVTSINRQTPAGQNTNLASVTWQVTFLEAVDGATVNSGDFTFTVVSGGVAGYTVGTITPQSTTVYDVQVNSITGDGELRMTLLPAATISDLAGNDYNATYNTGETYIFDHTAPTVVVTGPVSPTNNNPINFTLTFTEASGSVTAPNPASINVGNGNKGAITGGPLTYTLPVTPLGQGAVTCQVLAGAAQDAVGNGNTQSNNLSITYDSLPPTVSSIDRLTPLGQNTNAQTVVWRVTFSENVNNVAPGDFTVNEAGGISGASATGVSAASGQVIDVTVDTGSNNGVLRLDLVVPPAAITDDAGNPLADNFQSGQTYNIDKTPPAVSTIARRNPAGQYTKLGSVEWRVTFNEGVSGVDAGVFSLALVSGSISGQSITGVSPVSDSVYDVTVNTGSGDGTLRLDLPSTTVITDIAGNSPVSDYSGGQTYIVDKTNPIPVLSSAVGANTNTSFSVTAAFDQDVTGFDDTDVTVSNGGTVSDFADGPATYTFTITPVNQGPLQVQVLAGAADDLAGNPNLDSNTFATNYETVAPTVSATVPPNGAVVPGAPTISVTFDEAVTDVAPGDLTVNGSPDTNVSGNGAGPYLFSGHAAPADGIVTATLASGAITDLAGNAFAGYSWSYTRNSAALIPTLNAVAVSDGGATSQTTIHFTVDFTVNGVPEAVSNFVLGDITVSNASKGNFLGTGASYSFDVTALSEAVVTVQILPGVCNSVLVPGKTNVASSVYSYTYDVTPPTVTLTPDAGAVPQTNGPFTVSALFDQPVTGFTSDSITVSNAVISNFVGGGASYSWTVTPLADGLVQVSVPGGVAIDPAGNGNTASNAIDTNYDSIHPGVALGSTLPNPTNAAPISVTATFTEDVTGFDLGDVQVASGIAGNFAEVTSSVYTFDVTPSGADVIVSVDVASDAALDAAGNGNTAAPSLSRRYDSVAPIPSMTPPASPTNLSVTTFTLNFTEPVNGLDVSDLVVLNGAAGVVTGSGSGPYAVDVTAAGDGVVLCALGPASVYDDAGNTNTAQAQASITYDSVAPTVLNAIPTPGTTHNSLPSISVTFDEAVTSVSTGILTVNGSAATTVTGSGSGPYLFVGFAEPVGLTTVILAAGGLADLAGNPFAGTAWDYMIDVNSPLVDDTIPAQDGTATSLSEMIVFFNKAVINVAADDLVVSGSQATTITGSGAGPYVFSGFTSLTVEGVYDVYLGAGTIEDTLGNTFKGTTWTVRIDLTSPTVQSVSVHSGLSVDVVFDEAMGAGALDPANYSVSGSGKGTLPVHPASVQVVNDHTLRLVWSAGKMFNGGDITITVDNVCDAAGNMLGVPNSATHVGGAIANLPTVVVTRALGQQSPTTALPVNFSVTFSEDVTGFTEGDLIIEGTVGTNVIATVQQLTPATYNVRMTTTQPSEGCTFILKVADDAAIDAAGNASEASVNINNVIEYVLAIHPASAVDSWVRY